MKTFSIELDACVGICKINNNIVIDPRGDEEESHLLKCMARHGVEYEILSSMESKEWPFIKISGTIEGLSYVLELFSSTGQSQEEIYDIIKDWDGKDMDTIFEIIG